MSAITKDEAIKVLRDAVKQLENGAHNVAGNAEIRGDSYDVGYAKAMERNAKNALRATEHITDTAATQAAAPVYQFRQKFTEEWIECKSVTESLLEDGATAGCFEFRTLYVAAQTTQTDLSAVEVPPLPVKKAAVLALNKWLLKRGPLGPGATPDRPFFAGYAAGRASMKGNR